MFRMRRAATSLQARGVGGRDRVGVEEADRVGVRGMLGSAGVGAVVCGGFERSRTEVFFSASAESARAG